VTAAHCVTDDLLVSRSPTPPDNVSVSYGSADTATHTAAAVSAVAVAPPYLRGDNNYDAALLTLSQPLAGYPGPTVNRIPFASAGELNTAVNLGHFSVATGYGATAENGTVSQKMLAVSLPLRPDSACTGHYGSGGYSPPLSVCAGGTGAAADNNPDTCQGDSGGPLAIPVGGVLKVVGITSRGEGCGRPGVPAVYTEASNPEICAFLGATAECSPPPVAAPPKAAVRDTVKPSARLTSLRCKRRVCSFRVRTADPGGRVRSLSARVYRRVRVCRVRGGRRSCRTVLRNKKVKTKRITGGFSGRTRLAVARYRLDAVATDMAGNRSQPARKRFKVKKR